MNDIVASQIANTLVRTEGALRELIRRVRNPIRPKDLPTSKNGSILSTQVSASVRTI